MRSLLESDGVPYFVQGDTYINKYGPMMISHPAFGKVIWVEERHLPLVQALEAQFLTQEHARTDIAADAFTGPWSRIKKFFGLMFLGY